MKKTLFLKIEVDASPDSDPMGSLSDVATWAEAHLASPSVTVEVTAYASAGHAIAAPTGGDGLGGNEPQQPTRHARCASPSHKGPTDAQQAQFPKNVLGDVATAPFYIWANEDCDIKSNTFEAAKAIRVEMVNAGRKYVYIVDAEGVEVADDEVLAHEALMAHGFYAGARDANVNPGFPGTYMVNDPGEPEGYAIVGDNLRELILEARKHLIPAHYASPAGTRWGRNKVEQPAALAPPQLPMRYETYVCSCADEMVEWGFCFKLHGSDDSEFDLVIDKSDAASATPERIDADFAKLAWAANAICATSASAMPIAG